MSDGKTGWDDYKKRVKPVKNLAAAAPAGKTAVKKTAASKAAQSAANAYPPAVPKLSAGRPLVATPLERRREKALRQGDVPIDAKLDLHGMTQAKAFAALADFIARAAGGGHRHLLIVTGKGKQGEGILRASLRDWLGQLPEAGRILTVRQAALRHGGTGAFYILLRR